MDEWLVRVAVDHRVPVLDRFALALMHVGTSIITDAVLGIALGIWCWRRRVWHPLAAVVGSVSVAVLATDVAKDLIDRPRPPVEWRLTPASGFAMPSSVAALTAAAALSLALTVRELAPERCRVVWPALAALVVLAGWSVVYVGVHWPTDVLAGWALGVAVALGVWWVLGRFDELFVRPWWARRTAARAAVSGGA